MAASPQRTMMRGGGSEVGFFDLLSKAPSHLESAAHCKPDSSPNEEDAAYEEMIRIDKWRKTYMTMSDSNEWRILFQVKGTIIPTLIRHPIFWLSIGAFAALRTLVLLRIVNTDSEEGNFRGVTLFGSAVVFFLVFYGTDCYQRFRAQYFHAMDACNEIQSFAIFCRASMPRRLALRLVRQINAAQILAYICLSEGCDIVFLRGFNRAYHILMHTEMDVIEKFPLTTPAAMSVLIQWITIDINKGMVNEEITPIRGETLTLSADAVKKSLQKLFYYQDQQVPYIYVHLAALLTYVYLPLLAVVLAIGPADHESQILWEVQNAAALVFSCVFFLGLREVAKLMSNPFGNDAFDFPVTSFSVHNINECRLLMAQRDPEKINANVEARLFEQ